MFSGKKKSRTAEATYLLQHKNHQLLTLQIRCLEQEVEINKVKKKNVISEEGKLKLEIELLKKMLICIINHNIKLK